MKHGYKQPVVLSVSDPGPHLSWRLDTLPQAEVEDANNHDQAQGQVPAREAQVMDTSTLMKMQHTPPAEGHSQTRGEIKLLLLFVFFATWQQLEGIYVIRAIHTSLGEQKRDSAHVVHPPAV